ncbi:anthranilate phosphoribosyltransferase [Acidipila sp. EB88]|uniref:anthranilate phosphoribosyltransferase n=1 Tax=Acidipila sp. EB88 TaxID=2305226 RepID=UPI000F602080|nr:anthranilate phosphoribosyltransferase [Acidipila sp. EB88]RRA47585.1 anthranilate phosphoribosyltransferase [Acidipila sp. EB88]
MQTEEFRSLVKAVVEQGATLGRAEARGLLETLLAEPEGQAGVVVGGLARTLPVAVEMGLATMLAVMTRRGETAEELCGFAEAMRAAATRVPLEEAERALLVDTCGTGGDGLDTLNISTAAGLVAAGAGAWIAKHGNRAVTSRCGSADVLEALGVPIALAPAEAAECLRATRFMFLLAPMLHPAMARVAPVRRALPFRTIFNLAGPLTNPAGAAAQVVGVYAAERIAVVAEALRLLGTRHSWVVHGEVRVDAGSSGGGGTLRGLDELTVTGASVWATVRGGVVARERIEPESLGLRVAEVAELRGGATARASAALIEAVITGQDRGARREIVLLNAGAALVVGGVAATLAEAAGACCRGGGKWCGGACAGWVAREIVLLNAGAALVVGGVAATLAEGLERAAEAVESGAAVRVLAGLRAFGGR